MAELKKNDYKNMYLPRELTAFINKVYDTGFFKDRYYICKYGFAYAIKYHFEEFDPLEIDQNSPSDGFNWDVNSIDDDNFLKNFVLSAYPDCDLPYRYVRGIVIFGLKKLSDKLGSAKDIILSDLM